MSTFRKWLRYVALQESMALRQLPPHLWHHARSYAADLLRLYMAHGRIVASKPLDTADLIRRDGRAERDERQNANRRAARNAA